MAIALWNRLVFTSSMEKVLGSPLLLVQDIVAGPPDVRLLGTVKSTAKTKGRKKRMTLKAGRIMSEGEEYKNYRNVGKWKRKVKRA
jgi:hypothetical protein